MIVRLLFVATLCGILLINFLAGCSSLVNITGSRIPNKSDSFAFKNGEIWTANSWQEALIVVYGVITAVGTNEEIISAIPDGIAVRDLKGKAVFPGIHEMHVHGLYAGIEKLACSFPHGSEPDVIRGRVANCVQDAEPGEWIVGGNWVAAVFKEGEQNKVFLDAVAPNNPVILGDESHHSA